MPVGFTKTTIGIPRVGVNCAACHTTSVRKSPTDKPQLILGGPAHQFDIQAYQRFLIACANDPDFTADRILKELQYVYKFSFFEKALYRYVIIPFTKRGLLEQEKQFGWMNLRPDWGPGRTDMNPFKLMVLKLNDDRSVGNTDMMAIWNERKHEGFLRHSDGLNPMLIEASISAALATGATAKTVNIPAVQRVNQWLLDLPSPKYPFPVDEKLAAAGKVIFDRDCASCHAFGSARVGKLIPLSEVGTDPNRTKHWTTQAADEFNRQFDKYSWGFDHFQGSTGGYVALALDGIWARAPYLHNGSVPTLAGSSDTGEGPSDNVLSGQRCLRSPKGRVRDNRSIARWSRLLKIRAPHFPATETAGHTYGTTLPPKDKTALIEYLKTF